MVLFRVFELMSFWTYDTGTQFVNIVKCMYTCDNFLSKINEEHVFILFLILEMQCSIVFSIKHWKSKFRFSFHENLKRNIALIKNLLVPWLTSSTASIVINRPRSTTHQGFTSSVVLAPYPKWKRNTKNKSWKTYHNKSEHRLQIKIWFLFKVTYNILFM